MTDIFISYSSLARERARMLNEMPVSAGLSVWIDQSDIDLSSSSSKNIGDANRSIDPRDPSSEIVTSHSFRFVVSYKSMLPIYERPFDDALSYFSDE